MDSIKLILMGTDKTDQFLGYIFFAFIGVLISLLEDTATRDVNKHNSPIRFSKSFWIQDNALRILLGILLIYVSIRFSTLITGFEISEFMAFCIGLSIDILFKKVKSVKLG
ncbi:hypothetical protein D3C72_950770 [compost metagenome]